LIRALGTGYCARDGATPGRWLGRIDPLDALESKAASGFAVPKNPTTEHTTINIEAGSALDPIPQDWILCRGCDASQAPVVQINVTAATSLTNK